MCSSESKQKFPLDPRKDDGDPAMQLNMYQPPVVVAIVSLVIQELHVSDAL